MSEHLCECYFDLGGPIPYPKNRLFEGNEGKEASERVTKNKVFLFAMFLQSFSRGPTPRARCVAPYSSSD